MEIICNLNLQKSSKQNIMEKLHRMVTPNFQDIWLDR